jgi:NTE family protein
MIDGHFAQMKQLARTVGSCNKRLAQNCPNAPQIANPIATDFTFVELTFDDIPDPLLKVSSKQPYQLRTPRPQISR